jgi:single-stranded DNA-specific DHH superfamily exonuclease
MLPEEKYKELLNELDNCKNPLFIFDDDADGLCSFLLLYRYKKEGRWCFVKSLPKVSKEFVRYINNDTDKIFILDMPEVEEEFFDNVDIPIIWVDHHPHEVPSKVKSFNPHDHNISEIGSSTTALCYYTVKQDLWLAAVGAVADWTMPEYINDFKELYPDLLDKNIVNPPEALFDSRLSKIIEIFTMILKGNTKISKQCISKLIKLESPYELLNTNSKESKFIHNKIDPLITEFNSLIKLGLEIKPVDNIILFLYSEYNNSFSSEISNYLQYKNPDNIVIVGRLKNNEYKLSLRSQNIDINSILGRIMTGLDGYGGGHKYACGACISEHHFEEFIIRFKKEF